MSKVQTYFRVHEFERSRCVESNLITPKQLMISRGIISLFNLIVLICLIISVHNIPLTFGMFLTNFGFYGLTLYIWWSFYLSVRAYLKPNDYEPFIDLHYIMHLLYHILYETVIVYHFIISIIYWALLAKSELKTLPPLPLFLTIARHGFNFIFMLTEFILSRNLIYLTHYPIVLLFGILYICLALIIHEIHGVWAYPFFDYQKSPLMFGLVIGGIFIFSILYYGLVYYLHNLRDRLFSKRYQRLYSNSSSNSNSNV